MVKIKGLTLKFLFLRTKYRLHCFYNNYKFILVFLCNTFFFFHRLVFSVTVVPPTLHQGSGQVLNLKNHLVKMMVQLLGEATSGVFCYMGGNSILVLAGSAEKFEQGKLL